ncbi:hypothetical protein BJQ89_03460 [Arthrobacter sp. ES1]|nr:hypothetical protein [Arthrobacter sp. ES1]
MRARTRAGRAILHTVRAVLQISPEPPVGAGTGNTHFLRHMRHGTAAQNTLDKDASTGRSQTGITVDHEDLLVVWCVW